MMEVMDFKVGELVGIAAAVAGHCQPCFEYHLEQARKMGVSDGEIKAAVRIAQAVRKAGDDNMDNYVQEKLTVK
jgi:AhpD family alkylhydroperoxidase